MKTLEAVDTDFINSVTSFTDIVLGDMNASFDTPENSYGKCLQVTRAMANSYAKNDRIKVAYSEHSFADETVLERNMCINHYAVIIDNETVIDYTLRQFEASVDYPAIMPYNEWTALLTEKWEDSNAFHSIGNRICTDCLIGVDTLCDCDGHYPNVY